MTETPASMPSYPGQPPEFRAPTEETIEVSQSRFGKIVKRSGWVFLGIFSLCFFTLLKLPDERIKGYVQGGIESVLATRGITYTAESTTISYWLGIHYVMKNVTLTFPPPTPQARIDRIEISPNFLPIFLGKLGASVDLKNGTGSLNLVGALRGSEISGSLRADQFDIGKIGLMKLLSDVNASAVVTGRADFSGSTQDLSRTNADFQLDLSHISVESQSVQGFTIPALNISQGHVDVTIDHGRGQVRALKLGKADSPTDDIKGNLSGDLTLGKSLQTSTCNLKADFSFSQNLMKSFSLLDAILAQGKQPDGSYSYRLEGPLLSPNPIPIRGH